MEVFSALTALRSRVDRAIGFRDSLKARLESVKTDIKRLEDEESELNLVAELFRKQIDREVNIGVDAVVKLLTEGSLAVFDDQDVRVKSEVGVERGKVSVDLITVQKTPEGQENEGQSTDSFGGSVATVQSVLLRLLLILRRALRPIIFLDEALPAFDPKYVLNMGRFLSVLCARLKQKGVDLDLLVVTHNPLLVDVSDRAYKIINKDGRVGFEKIRTLKAIEAPK